MARYFLAFLCLLLAVAAQAQVNFANLHGVVLDPQQKPISNATVVLTGTETGATRYVVTNTDGLYEAPTVASGTYTVSVAVPGFAPLSRTLTLEVGQNLDLDFHLQIVTVAQSVSVQAGSVAMDSTKTSVGEVVEPKSIQDLPMNGRMILDLVTTVPGAHMGAGAQTGVGNARYWRPDQDSAFSIGGNRPNANYYLLDGAVNTDPTFWTQNISLSLDAIQEFRVDVSSYTASESGGGRRSDQHRHSFRNEAVPRHALRLCAEWSP